MEKKVEKFVQDYDKLKAQDKLKKLTSIETDLFTVVLKQLEATETVIKKFSGFSDKECKTVSNDLGKSQTCLERLRGFIPKMEVNTDVKFGILQKFVPLVIQMGDVSLRIVTDITHRVIGAITTAKTEQVTKTLDNVAEALKSFTDAVGSVFESIVDHDVVELIFQNEATFEKNTNQKDRDECKTSIQSICLQFCTDVSCHLTTHIGDLAFSANRCSVTCRTLLDAMTKLLRCYKCAATPLRHILKYTSEQFWKLEIDKYRTLLAGFYELSVIVTYCLRSLSNNTKGDTLQEKVLLECRKLEAEREQAGGVVISSVTQNQQPTVDELKFGMYWTQTFSFSVLKHLQQGGVLCESGRVYINQSTLIEVQRETLHSDVTIFLLPMDAGTFLQEFPDRKMAEAEGIDAVITAFTTKTPYTIQGPPRNLYFDLSIAYDEKLVTLMCKSKTEGKWDKGRRLERKDNAWTLQTNVVGDMVIYCSFPSGEEVVTPEGLTIDIANTNYVVRFPSGCVSSKQKVQYKLGLLDQQRIKHYHKNYPSIFHGVSVSDVITVDLQKNTRLQKPAQVTFPLTNGSEEGQPSLVHIEGTKVKQLDNKATISEDKVTFEVDHFSGYACTRGRQRQDVSGDIATSSDSADVECDDPESVSDFERQLQTPFMDERAPDATDTAGIDENETVKETDIESSLLQGLGFFGKVKLLLGLDAPCNFILSYRERCNPTDRSRSVFIFRVDCIDILHPMSMEEWRSVLKEKGWKDLKTVIPFRQRIVTNYSHVVIKVNGNLTLIGNEQVKLTFMQELPSPTLFRVQMNEEDLCKLFPEEPEKSVAFVFLSKSGSATFNWMSFDTRVLMGEESSLGYDARRKKKMEQLVTSNTNIDRVHEYVSTNEDDLKALLSKMTISKKKTPAEEMEVIRTRIRAKKKEKGVSETFLYLMELLDFIKRNDISLRLLQLALRGQELPPPSK